jgi:hypothetical protein
MMMLLLFERTRKREAEVEGLLLLVSFNSIKEKNP